MREVVGIEEGGGGWKVDSIGIPMELDTKMAEAAANWFPPEFHGIPARIPLPANEDKCP